MSSFGFFDLFFSFIQQKKENYKGRERGIESLSMR